MGNTFAADCDSWLVYLTIATNTSPTASIRVWRRAPSCLCCCTHLQTNMAYLAFPYSTSERCPLRPETHSLQSCYRLRPFPAAVEICCRYRSVLDDVILYEVPPKRLWCVLPPSSVVVVHNLLLWLQWYKSSPAATHQVHPCTPLPLSPPPASCFPSTVAYAAYNVVLFAWITQVERP